MNKPSSQEVIDFLNSRWGSAPCPMCNGRRWTVSDKVFELREFNDGNIVVGGPNSSVTPIIPIVCEYCGNTLFISIQNRSGKNNVRDGRNQSRNSAIDCGASESHQRWM